jgi:uncharacterized protein YbcI
MVNDTVVCMLRDGFTTVERTLIDDGKPDQVHNIRRSFQQTMKEQFTKVVEDATKREVIAYMSEVHTDPDMAMELFVLEPAESPVVAEHELQFESPEAE